MWRSLIYYYPCVCASACHDCISFFFSLPTLFTLYILTHTLFFLGTRYPPNYTRFVLVTSTIGWNTWKGINPRHNMESCHWAIIGYTFWQHEEDWCQHNEHVWITKGYSYVGWAGGKDIHVQQGGKGIYDSSFTVVYVCCLGTWSLQVWCALYQRGTNQGRGVAFQQSRFEALWSFSQYHWPKSSPERIQWMGWGSWHKRYVSSEKNWVIYVSIIANISLFRRIFWRTHLCEWVEWPQYRISRFNTDPYTSRR